MDDCVTICSMNCRGLGDPNKRKDVFNFLKGKKMSIYCLQDTHLVKDLENKVKDEWKEVVIFSHKNTQSRGTAILFTKNIDYEITNENLDLNGNWVALNIKLYEHQITLITIYGPNEDSPGFYRKIKTIIDDFNNPHTIICGDWNLTLDQNLDNYNYIHVNNPQAKQTVLLMKEDLDLVDPWRHQHPNTKRYTWRKTNPIKQARLDFFLTSKELLTLINKTYTIPGYRTDHSAVVISLNLNPIKRGKGYWKMNNILLSDITYINLVKDKITEFKKLYALFPYNIETIENIPIKEIQFQINDQTFFELLMMSIRDLTISYSIKRSKERRKEEADLVKEITNLEDKMNLDPNGHTDEQLRYKKNILINLRTDKMMGSMMRAKAEQIEYGEKPSKFFLNLEKKNFMNKAIKRLTLENQMEITNQEEIRKEIYKFYENMYKNKDENLDIGDFDDLVNRNDIQPLDEIAANNLEGPLEYDEVLNVLKKMSNNKSPGPDGFTVEFFKFFWVDISYFLIRSLNYGYQNNALSPMQQHGIISLLPKGDKPRQFLKNWRPISLLNITYKIASAAIAERIKQVLPQLISMDQKGFMAGRYIGENIRLIYDVLQYTDFENIPGMIVLLDFEKAFDSVSHQFIFKVLELFNFGQSLKKWIKVFYSNSSSSIQINGHLTNRFSIDRGCRQGDALSPYIFLLCAEILSVLIKKNPNIKGIKVGDTEITLSQYADDTNFILDGSDQSLRSALQVLDRYYRISGLKINESKTKIIWIGRNKYSAYRIKTRKKIGWIEDGQFSCLGVDFSLNINNMEKDNYERVYANVKKLCDHWAKRNISVLGRVTVVKSLILPKFNHLILTLPSPSEEFMKKLQTDLFKFIWKGNDKIKRTQMINEKESGGVKMIDLKEFFEALKITWIRRLVNSSIDEKIGALFVHCTSITNKNVLYMGGNYVESKAVNTSNLFWKDVLFSWGQLLKKNTPVTINEFLRQSLWNNELFKIGGEIICLRRWQNKGVMFVSDLFDVEGKIYKYEDFKSTYNIKTNFLEYEGICRSVTTTIKKNTIFAGQICSIELPFRPFHFDVLFKEKKGCKTFYKILTSDKVTDNKEKRQKWEQVLRTTITEEKWRQVNKSAFDTLIESKLTWFQFRINNRILATNSFLARIHIRNNNLCTFCELEEESLSHLFIECRHVKIIWTRFCIWIREKCNFEISLKKEHCILGLYPHKKQKAINKLIIWCKWIIYKNKLLGNIPVFLHIQRELKQYYETERFISYKNLNQEHFEKEWLLLKRLFL